MKHLSLLLTVFFFSVLAQAQEKKSKAAAAQKQQAAPVKNAKAASSVPSLNALSNDIAGEAAKKLPPYRPALLADSLVKFSPVLEPGTDALKSPYIIVAPNASDEESYNYFHKMASELSEVKGVRNTVVKGSKDEVLAVAINNPSFIQLFNERKKYISIKTYVFSSLKALENSTDRWIQYLNREKSLTKEIILQNTDYLPNTSEIKGADEKIAP